MALLRAQLDGKVYGLDPDSITSREYKVIKQHTGLSLNKFWFAVTMMHVDTDVEVLDALRWLFLKRSGVNVDLLTDDDYAPADLMLSLIELNKDEEQPEEEDPKVSDATPESM